MRSLLIYSPVMLCFLMVLKGEAAIYRVLCPHCQGNAVLSDKGISCQCNKTARSVTARRSCVTRATPLLLTLLFSMPTPSLVQADRFRKQVTSATEDYLKVQALRISQKFDATHFKVKAYPLPKRVKESPCPIPLKVSAVKAPGPGMQQLKVVCPSGSQWSLYVKGQIAIFMSVLVSQEVIAIGTSPTEMQMTWKDRDIGKLIDGYYSDPINLNQLKARVRIRPDTVLTPAMFSQKQQLSTEPDAFSNTPSKHHRQESPPVTSGSKM